MEKHMVKLVVSGVALVILIIYFIIRRARGEKDFDSDQLKACAIGMIIPIVAAVIFFIWLLYISR